MFLLGNLKGWAFTHVSDGLSSDMTSFEQCLGYSVRVNVEKDILYCNVSVSCKGLMD